MLNNEQSEFALSMFSQWMRICDENNVKHEWVDIDHSSLLRRLLLGGKPHKNPPPLRFSYPAWELVEQEEIQIQELTESFWKSVDGNAVVVVDQNASYEWVDKEKKIIKHTKLGILYQYSEREVIPDRRHVSKDLNPEDHKYIGKFLKRLNDPPTGKEEIWEKKD